MKVEMESIFYALLSFTSWGVGDNIAVTISRKTNATTVTFIAFTARLIIYTCIIPLFWDGIGNITITAVMWSMLVGASSTIGNWFFCKGSKISNPVIVGAVAGGWGAPALILSLIFLGEAVTALQSFSILAIFAGVFLVSFTFKSLRQLNLIKDKGVLYGLIAMLFWGICGSFLKIPVEQMGWFWTTYFFVIPFVLLFPLTRIDKERIINPFKSRVFIAVICYAVLITLSEVGYNKGLETGKAVIVASIAGSYSVLFAVIAYFLFRERLERSQFFGVVITLLGIVALSFLTSF